MIYKIEKSIPIPDYAAAANFSDLARKMRVGDSVKFSNEGEAKRLCTALRQNNRAPLRRKIGKDFWRVWRVRKPRVSKKAAVKKAVKND